MDTTTTTIPLDLEQAARRCAELGNPTRLAIFRLLVKAGRRGLPVGAIQKHLAIPGSTLTHHLRRLVQVGLINQRRQSRILQCEPQLDAVRELADYLVSECCTLQREPAPAAPAAGPAAATGAGPRTR